MNSALVRPAVAVAVALFAASPAAAQVIPLKTVPIASGEQFLLYPSSNLGMAGVSIAVDDPAGDAFWNPARGALLDGFRLFAAPTLYGEANDALGGRTLPIALSAGNGRQFGTAMVALQQLDEFRSSTWGWAPLPPDPGFGGSTINTYAHAGLGFAFPDGRTAVGASGLYADLNALDGVSQLYRRASQLEQDGRMTELRVGVLHRLDGDRMLDLVGLIRDLDMTHRQHVATWTAPDTAPWEATWTSWVETGHDRTTTRAVQARYTLPLAGEGSRLGFLAGGSWKSHPKIPEYDLNFPRDPGTSRAFALGVGLAETRGRALFSLEATFEPAWSHTWAVADSGVIMPSGGVIGAGERTVDNRFRFSNWSLASGIHYDREGVDFQLGLRVRAIQYDLEQHNLAMESYREAEEGWIEWSPSWAAIWHLDDVELRYTGRWISKGNPSNGCWGGCADPVFDSGGDDIDYLIAPDQAVDLPDYRVTTHRFSVSLPLGRSPHQRQAPEPAPDDTEGRTPRT